MAETRTTCPYCGVGCGVIIRSGSNGAVEVLGDPEHPANQGRLCSKGAALGETLGMEERLLHPEVNGRRVSWDTALDTVAEGLRRTIQRHGPDAVAFYLSGQLLTEDYYAANKLMKGFIGSANVDTNSRLCMASPVAGQRRAYGADAVPLAYEDLELASLVVIVGSNTAWCHPVVFQRLAAARRDNPALRVVVIDPRYTDTCAIADLHLPLAPGSDAVLFNGLLAWLEGHGLRDEAFVRDHTTAADKAVAAARQSGGTVAAVAGACALPAQDVEAFYRLFGDNGRTVTLFSQGINQSTSGTDKVNAIINCHLLTGRIGRPGSGPFSLTGQPNAMGGREVGGLANQLAAHMDFAPEHVDLVSRFWAAPATATRPGLKALELFEAIERGQVRAVWIMGTNPAVSLPEADRFREALRRCDLVVASDVSAHSETVGLARVRLPALGWGEKSGTVTNSERRISRQRPFLAPPGEARADWRAIAGVAQRLGFGTAFGWQGPAGIFREHAALSGFENRGGRLFDISGLASLTDGDYDRLMPIQWPVTRQRPAGTGRLFTEHRFATTDGRARLVAVAPQRPAAASAPGYPLTLLTGRTRDQWHTMTRTGLASRLWAHAPEPWVALHPDDARRFGLAAGELAAVESPAGRVVARTRVTEDQRPGTLFMPFHWSACFTSHGRVGALIPAHRDALSGQPEYKAVATRIRPWHARWEGFVLSREQLDAPLGSDRLWWSRSRPAPGLWQLALAGTTPADRLPDQLPGVWDDTAEYHDPATGGRVVARFQGRRLAMLLMLGPPAQRADRTWLAGLFHQMVLSDDERAAVLAGRPRTASGHLGGPVVCACHGVTTGAISAAVAAGAASLDTLGLHTGAGTGCGSCRPELERLLACPTASTRSA